ncbi:MAG: class I SAM-dependent methyltransferase [Flavobacteriales bacterium]|nr:class I SAM-dependent methyltransferase [Flavobacteriales bacterium]
MEPRFNRNRIIVAVGAPIAVAAIGVLAHAAWGGVGLVAPMALATAIVVLLLIDLRHHRMQVFAKQYAEGRSAFHQIEAIMGLNALLRPELPLPATRSWAAAPDLLREVATHCLTRNVRLAVEAGSGVSTLVMAYCFKRKGHGHVIALEHDAKYAERSRQVLSDHGLSDFATVVHAPLVKQMIDGRDWQWYDLSGVSLDAPIDLLLVDGPPDTTQPLARWPALPLLKAHLAPGATVILDDGDRDDERETARRWKAAHPAATLDHLPLEGGTWVLRL